MIIVDQLVQFVAYNSVGNVSIRFSCFHFFYISLFTIISLNVVDRLVNVILLYLHFLIMTITGWNRWANIIFNLATLYLIVDLLLFYIKSLTCGIVIISVKKVTG